LEYGWKDLLVALGSLSKAGVGRMGFKDFEVLRLGPRSASFTGAGRRCFPKFDHWKSWKR